ncbi:MAG TPA: four-carbon acid sugar kinase family protein [Desulfopila sp.]|nr:four-carbon acid sugar kinase family protein [Desulfopila sp.]
MTKANILDVIVIADDLTGGADTGVQFCRIAGRMFLKHYSAETLACANGKAGGLSIFTNSRHVEAAEAAERVTAALFGVGSDLPPLIYKKIDSCLRGNIGAELDAVLRQSRAEISFVAPALPAQGRTTRDDVHMVDGVPVAQTEIGRDPLCPVKESQLSVLLGVQSDFQVGHVGLDWIASDLGELEKRLWQLIRHGCRHIVFDALSTEHLQTIALLARRHLNKVNILLAGSAGLASAVVDVTAADRQKNEGFCRPSVRRWLFVCGSASQVMKRQVERLTVQADMRHLYLQPDELVAEEGAPLESPSSGGSDLARSSSGTVMSLAPISEAAAQQVEPNLLVAAVARHAASVLQRDSFDGLFLSGGDTAEAVLGDIAAGGICLQEEILPGLVLGAVVGGNYNGLPVVTKAGAFGSDDALLELIQQLK